MIYARNEIVVGSAYSQVATFPLPEGVVAAKLDIHVFDNDIICEPSEVYPVVFADSIDHEMRLYKGFHSRVPETRWTAVRFKSLGVSSRITFVLYD